MKTLGDLMAVRASLKYPHRIETDNGRFNQLIARCQTESEAMERLAIEIRHCEQWNPESIVTWFYAPRKLSERAVVKRIDLSL